MTENEAIKQLKIQRTFTNGSNAKVEAIDIAIQALEKQIPKKPITDDRYIMYICPCCNDFIKVSHNYCPNCGQKIDFGE